MASSLGGISALTRVLSLLPADFKAAIVIVQHLWPAQRSHLADLLNRNSALTIRDAREGDLLQPATAYIAMPDRHVLLNLDGSLTLTDTDKVNFVRPSADRLFVTASQALKERVIGVVLTGTGQDGTLGVQAIKAEHGFVIAQDKATSKSFEMPKAAIATGMVDVCLPLDEIAATLVALLEG